MAAAWSQDSQVPPQAGSQQTSSTQLLESHCSNQVHEVPSACSGRQVESSSQ